MEETGRRSAELGPDERIRETRGHMRGVESADTAKQTDC